MDLRLLIDEPTEAERAAVDAVIGPPEGGWDGGTFELELDGHTAESGHEQRGRRHRLLPALHALQASAGWISPGGMGYVCKRLDVPPADAYGVATFYALFSLDARPPRVLHACDDLACRCAGAAELIAQLEERFGPEGSNGGAATWLRSPCLGQCDRAPAALLIEAGDAPHETVLAPVDTATALRALSPASLGTDPSATASFSATPDRGSVPATPAPGAPEPGAPEPGAPTLRLLRRAGRVRPTSLDDYRAHGGYQALRRAHELGPERVIREVKDSKLLGRGGAAFPMGVKWDAVARAPARPHYLIVNADESEPGTFKDRTLIEGDPYALIEAMTIAAYATGCARGYVYLRGEYPVAHAVLGEALTQARRRGLLGDFEIEVRKGAGAYICGEETAIFNSIEGFRGEPRNKPPFPVAEGLFGKPTLVNNVETIVNVLGIVLEGGPAFAATGTPDSTGTKLFCVSGHVARPGTYEVAFGTTLSELLTLAGGVTGPLQTVLLGGAAGVFVGPDALDLPLTFEGARAAKATLGSGVVIPMDDTVDVPRMLMRIAAFMRDESCGQCVPCRVGTVRQEEALARLLSGRTRGGVGAELALLGEIGQCMRDASICGLGQTASSAIESAIGRLGVFGGVE